MANAAFRAGEIEGAVANEGRGYRRPRRGNRAHKGRGLLTVNTRNLGTCLLTPQKTIPSLDCFIHPTRVGRDRATEVSRHLRASTTVLACRLVLLVSIL